MKSVSSFRPCADIGCYVIDRPQGLSCKWKTDFCATHCYTLKEEKAWKISKANNKLISNWVETTGETVKKEMPRKRKLQTKRVRFCSRGEAIGNEADIEKIRDIARKNRDRVFWIPTRAWRSERLRPLVRKLADERNIRLLASIDPSNTQAEIDGLVSEGFSTMFFGNDTESPQPNPIVCKKTFGHIKGHCANCGKGCFNSGQKHVWLKEH